MVSREAKAFLEEGDFQFVRFEQSDLHGLSRSKTVPVRHFSSFADNGLNFFGGLLGLDLQGDVASGTGYMDERNFADTLLLPDESTIGSIPWADRTARIICEPRWYDGTPAKASPRYVMRQMTERLGSMGYDLRSGFEYELYLVDAETRRPVFEGIQIFWTLRNNFDPGFVDSLLQNLAAGGIDVITSNAEYGPGQMEINFTPSLGDVGADQAFIFKSGVKEMACQRGYIASFMTRPYADQSSSGSHYHHSLIDRRTKQNAFFDASAADGLSELARFWIGGQISHASALTALVGPTINCAKRYKLFSFAPMNATWGYEDRTAAIRVKGGREENTHVENRMPCAGSNPYLVAAACLAAGIDGISNRIEPPPALRQIAYVDATAKKLPRTLDESLRAFKEDSALQSYLGDEFVKLFVAVKQHEIEKARMALPEYDSAEWPDTVSDWERASLFEYL